jgi:hypothetical protein
MSSDVSVTRLIGMLKDGDRGAAQQLWETYLRRLVGLVRARLQNTARRHADEEDVAFSAFASFYRRAECGARLGCVEKPVERKLRTIRQIWSGEACP